MTAGFILTRQHFDTPQGVELHFWIKCASGIQQVIIDQQEAVCFIAKQDVPAALACLKQAPALHGRMQNLTLHTFAQQTVTGIYFKQQRQLYEAVERLEAAGIRVLEKDIRPTERYLMERFIRAGVSITGGQRNNQGALLNPKLKAAEFNPLLRVVSLDIETSFNSNELYCIGLSEGDFELVLMKGQGQDNPTLRHYPDEKSLLLGFSQWVQDYDPDIFIGWNVINFDFRFLANKFEQYRLPFNLGRQQLRGNWRTANEGQQHFVTLPGRLVVDGIDSLKAATYHFESYSLENVSRELLGTGKKIDNVDNRGEEIQNLYRDDPSALAAYNLQDCRLVEQIFDHTQVLNYLIERAYLTGLPLDKYGGSTASFDNLYLPLLHRSGYIAPDYNSGATGLNAPGGYVMESKPGLYENVLVLDFKSLYPSIIRTFFIDPMGLAIGINAGDEEATDHDSLAGYNGAMFSRSEHHLPGLIDTLWQARDKAKHERNAAVSQAIKIIMNSFYGVLGSPGCRFFDQRLSSSITLRGHHILQRSQRWIEQQGHQVIYGDTDSVFVWIKQDCSTAQAEAIGKTLQQGLNQWWTQTLQDELALESRLEIEFETHYTRFFMPTIRGSEKGSKKRYCGQVINPQGNKRMIFKGLESVRTDWTPLARRFQQTLYEMIFEQQDWAQFIRDTVEQLKGGELNEELIYRKRLRRKLDDYIRNVPPHVQAARKADQWLQSQGQAPRYARGGWIRYTMTLSGPEPLENSLSALDYDFYIERQLAPIADAILPLLGHHFAEFSEPQITLL